MDVGMKLRMGHRHLTVMVYQSEVGYAGIRLLDEEKATRKARC